MKGIIFYSSVTGNTKKLAEQIYDKIKSTGGWSIFNINEGNLDIQDADVVLFGGWAEGGSLNKAAQKVFYELDFKEKRVGLFMTMGSRTQTEHGHMCEENLKKLLENHNSLGVQTLQGSVTPALMAKLAELPDMAIPQSVKTAMIDGVENYKEPTDAEYAAIATFFKTQL